MIFQLKIIIFQQKIRILPLKNDLVELVGIRSMAVEAAVGPAKSNIFNTKSKHLWYKSKNFNEQSSFLPGFELLLQLNDLICVSQGLEPR